MFYHIQPTQHCRSTYIVWYVILEKIICFSQSPSEVTSPFRCFRTKTLESSVTFLPYPRSNLSNNSVSSTVKKYLESNQFSVSFPQLSQTDIWSAIIYCLEYRNRTQKAPTFLPVQFFLHRATKVIFLKTSHLSAQNPPIAFCLSQG